MAEFFNDRRPAGPARDDSTPLGRAALLGANAQLRDATPEYRKDDVNRRIRTAAVQRHRSRRAGLEDFATVGEYACFITGTEE